MIFNLKIRINNYNYKKASVRINIIEEYINEKYSLKIIIIKMQEIDLEELEAKLF